MRDMAAWLDEWGVLRNEKRDLFFVSVWAGECLLWVQLTAVNVTVN